MIEREIEEVIEQVAEGDESIYHKQRRLEDKSKPSNNPKRPRRLMPNQDNSETADRHS